MYSVTGLGHSVTVTGIPGKCAGHLTGLESDPNNWRITLSIMPTLISQHQVSQQVQIKCS